MLIIVKGRAASDSEIELDHVLDVVTTAFGHMSHLHAGIVHDLLHVVEAYQKHRMSQLVAVSSTPESGRLLLSVSRGRTDRMRH